MLLEEPSWFDLWQGNLTLKFFPFSEMSLRFLKRALHPGCSPCGCVPGPSTERNVEHVKGEGYVAFEVHLFDVSLSLSLIINGTLFSLSNGNHPLQPQALKHLATPFVCYSSHANKPNLVGEGREKGAPHVSQVAVSLLLLGWNL